MLARLRLESIRVFQALVPDAIVTVVPQHFAAATRFPAQGFGDERHADPTLQQGPLAAVNVVPEPTALAMLIPALFAIQIRLRRERR